MEPVRAIIETVFHLVSILAVFLAAITYWRNARTRRAEWLFSLYQKFFEEPHHKEMRWLLDYRPDPAYLELQRSVANDTPDRSAEPLVDYLNFFEFTARLWRSRQLKLKEVKGLFQYYLENLTKHDFIRKFIRTEGFEALDELLDKMVG
jgi:hypothetical protein